MMYDVLHYAFKLHVVVHEYIYLFTVIPDDVLLQGEWSTIDRFVSA